MKNKAKVVTKYSTNLPCWKQQFVTEYFQYCSSTSRWKALLFV